MERHLFIKGNLQQPDVIGSYAAGYHNELEQLGSKLDVDLSGSKDINPREVFLMRDLGITVVDWLFSQGYPISVEAESLKATALQAAVLTSSDHHAMRIASKALMIRPIQESFQRLVSQIRRDNPPDIAQQYIQHYYQIGLQEHEDELREIRETPLLASVIYLPDGADFRKFPLYVASFERSGEAVWTTEAIVAEETIHLATNIEKNLPLQIPEITHGEANHLEELGIKYYVAKALRDSGVPKDELDRFQRAFPCHIESWRRFIEERGNDAVDDFFFNGNGSVNVYNSLAVIINTIAENGIN